jgi:uncharacterized membrane protein (DUF106 family)
VLLARTQQTLFEVRKTKTGLLLMGVITVSRIFFSSTKGIAYIFTPFLDTNRNINVVIFILSEKTRFIICGTRT